MNVLLAHPGTQYSYRLAAELRRRDALGDFYTGAAFVRDGLVDRATQLMPAGWQRRVANRRLGGVPRERLHTRPLSELAAMWQLRRGGDGQEVWHRRAEAFQRSIPERALAAASAVIGFDTAAWVLVERCARVGVPMVLDQSIGHPDAKVPAYALVREQYPAWNDGVETRRPEVRAAEQQEHDGAARIVAASSFTRQSLVAHGVEAAKIRVNPYGVDLERFQAHDERRTGPMRFVFVGLVNARKGVPLLVDAWRRLAPGAGEELWIVGRAGEAARRLVPELPGLKMVGAVPHEEVGPLMQQCDVLVFPSYFEGFGLVLLEAMACGLAVITTTATAGPDIVTQGTDGWVIEPGDLEGLEERMAWCLEHPREVRAMGREARTTAERFTWGAYGDRWIEILGEVCGST
jgi:glycosyltransferase involved in cell wall biosynthesis